MLLVSAVLPMARPQRQPSIPRRAHLEDGVDDVHGRIQSDLLQDRFELLSGGQTHRSLNKIANVIWRYT